MGEETSGTAVLQVEWFGRRAGALGTTGWVLAALAVAFAGFSQLTPPGLATDATISDLGILLATGYAAISCWWTSRAIRAPREARAWQLMAAAALVGSTAAIYWTYHEVLLGREMPAYPPAGVLVLACYPLAFAGLLQLAPAGRGQLVSAFDALLFTLGAAGVSWQNLIAPLLAQSGDPALALVSIAPPVGDLLLVFALVSLFTRLPSRSARPHFALMLAGGFCLVAADTVFAVLLLGERYVSGSPSDALWLLGYALVGLAAQSRARQSAQSSGPTAEPAIDGRALNLRIALPYAALPAAAYMAFVDTRQAPVGAPPFADTSPTLLFAALLVGLVFARQFLTLLENRQLNLTLAREREDLARRTAQLAALNQAAARLGNCTSLASVLSVGLKLACETLDLPGGLVWLAGHSGQPEPASRRGLLDDEASLLCRLAAGSEGRAAVVSLPRADSSRAMGRVLASALVAPVVASGQILGALVLCGFGDGPAGGPADLQFAEAMGAQLGQAVEEARRYEEARELADRDPVTHLLNHRAFHERLERELARSELHREPTSVVMMDLDGLKLFNDTYGHQAGDEVLRQVARTLAETARSGDALGRYGGDEFVALLPATPRENASALAERLIQAIALHPFIAPDGSAVPIKLSFGIATYPDDASRGLELIAYADANLYASKHRGGDRAAGGERSRDLASVLPHDGPLSMLTGLVAAADGKDHYTRRHSEEVTVHALRLACALGLPDATLQTLTLAGLLHDVGKIGVPDHILRKPGKLTEEEQAAIKRHVPLAELLIKGVPGIADVAEVLAAVGSHHERIDGGGYPRGLRGADIPLLGRILAVADAYSAMTMDRPYRAGLTPEAARAELRRVAGSQLDPELVERFLELI